MEKRFVNTDCGLFDNSFKNSVLDALIPANERNATISELLPPTAALYTASIIADVNSGAIEPILAEIAVNTPDIPLTSVSYTHLTLPTKA